MTAFLSYNQTQRNLAEALHDRLETVGLEVWMERQELKPGQPWREAIERAIRKADSVILLIGSGNETSHHQRAEWQAAVEASWDNPKKRLIPVLLRGAEIPAFLRSSEPGRGVRYILLDEGAGTDLTATARAIKKLATEGHGTNGTRAQTSPPALPEDNLILTDRTDHRAEAEARFDQIREFAQKMRLAG